MTYSLKTSPVVSAIMGRIKYHAIDNGDVDINPSDFPVPDTDTTLIKSIYDDEMDYIRDFSHL